MTQLIQSCIMQSHKACTPTSSMTHNQWSNKVTRGPFTLQPRPGSHSAWLELGVSWCIYISAIRTRPESRRFTPLSLQMSLPSVSCACRLKPFVPDSSRRTGNADKLSATCFHPTTAKCTQTIPPSALKCLLVQRKWPKGNTDSLT